MDIRRHAPLGRVRPRFAPASLRSRPHAYVGRSGRPLSEIYASDHADSRRGGRFRWLLSTCLAAAVGVLAVLVAIAGSIDPEGSKNGLFASLEQRLLQTPLALPLQAPRQDGLRWAVPKTDKMLIPSGAAGMRSYHADPIKQRRGKREYTLHKFYVRLAARLGPISRAQAAAVPAFNAYKLYADATPLAGGDRDGPQDLAAPAKILELNGILPNEDGQELDSKEVAALVARAQAAEVDPGTVGGELLAGRARRIDETLAPQTTALHKTVYEPNDLADDVIGHDLPPIKVRRGDTLTHILTRLAGGHTPQVPAMVAATRSVLADSALQPGYEIRAVALPSPASQSGDLVQFSVFDQNGDHKVTVTRNATGNYVPSAAAVGDQKLTRVALSDSDRVQDSSLYASFYHVATQQGLPSALILQVLRIHAYGTDFRQRVRAGDGVELFFDVKGEGGIDGELGELLATFVTAGGTTRKFYRFRTPDGVVDFYDASGSTARKFLMRRPVRGDNVRLTSGFGMRKHPLLHFPRMHWGVDWASPKGTPIMAAGNGIIEFAGAKGENGNYIRIRHANGYKTAYAHMAGFAAGVATGVRVRQGQTIGYVGSSGLSSGPHLHFEVMVKNRFDGNYTRVDPRTIPVPNDRQLAGKDLIDFKRERARIDALMRRPAVRTAHLPS